MTLCVCTCEYLHVHMHGHSLIVRLMCILNLLLALYGAILKVSHGSLQFAAYEEGRRFAIELRGCSSDDKDRDDCLVNLLSV